MEKSGKSINIEESIQTLTDLGLSHSQAKIYLAILAMGPTSISKIAYASRVARPDTYRGISELQELGIVEKIVALPTKAMPLPITEAIGVLMLRRTKENIDLDKRANKLVECLKEKENRQTNTEEHQFVLIQGEAVELELEKMLEKSKENLSIMFSWKKMLQLLGNQYPKIQNALERRVNIRIITEGPCGSNQPKKILGLKKFPNFEWRYAIGSPAVWFSICDNREILFRNSKLDQTYNGSVFSNNSSLVELAQNYFNSAWFSAIEPQDQKFKHDSRQFDYLFSNLTNGFAYNKMIFSADGRAVDYVILGLNNAFEKIVGVGKNQLYERASKVLPSDIAKDLTALIDSYWPLISAGKTVSFEYNSAILGKWLSILAYSPEKGYFVTIVEDITERKKVEESLRISEENFRAYLESSPISVFVANSDGKYVYVNEAACRLLAYSREELLNMTIGQVGVKENSPERKFNELREKGYFAEETTLKQKNDKTIDVFLNASKLPDGKLVAFCEDITELKKAEITLRESEEKYRHLAKYAPAAIYEINCKSLKFESVNDCMCILSGYSEQELLSMSPFDLLDSESKSLFQEIIKKSFAGEKIDENVVFGVATKQGNKLWVNLTAKLTYKNNELDRAFVVAHDITEKKKSEELLKESEEKFRELSEDSPHMIFINKLGRIVYVNKKCEEILGYTKEEFYSLDFNFLDIVPAEDRDLVVSNFKKHSQGQEVSPFEITHFTKDGNKIKVLLNTKLIKYGRETAVLGTAINLTGNLKRSLN